MTYLDDDTLLFTVTDRDCVESVDLSALSQPITYAGQCGSKGSNYEGHRIHDARITRPRGILSPGENLIYFTTSAHSSVGIINSHTDQVTILSTGLPRARMLTYDPHHNALLVGVNHGIMRVNISDGNATWLSGSPQEGSGLNDSNNAQFIYPVDTVVVSDTAIIVSDRDNNRQGFIFLLIIISFERAVNDCCHADRYCNVCYSPRYRAYSRIHKSFIAS